MSIDRDKIAKNALRFIQKGQFHRAIDEYKKVLALDPRDIRTRLKLIDLYGRAGKKRDAIDECMQVSESYADQGFYLKAIAVYKQALRIDPDSPSLLRQMGEMYVKQGLQGDALGAFKRGVEVLRTQGEQEEAQELLERMEEMAPENIAIKIHLSELYLQEGKYDAFEQELDKIVLQLRGEGRSRKLLKVIESFYETSKHHPSVLRRLADLYVDLGEEERALGVIREGLARVPGDRNLRLLALRAHLVLGQLVDARRMAFGLYEEDPDDLFILEQLAAIAQARGSRDEMAEAYKSMAKVYGRKGLPQKEEAYYQKVLELCPDDAEARVALGDVIVESQTEEAEEEIPGFEIEWGGAEEPTPTDPSQVRDGLVEAELYLRYGIEEKAAAKLLELTEIAPEDVEIRQKLRDLYQRQGNRDGWVREQLHIARLFLREKRETEALRAYEGILEVDPQNSDALKSIQLLRPDASRSPRTARAGTSAGGPDYHGAIEFAQDGGEERAWRRDAGPAELNADEALREALAEVDFQEAQGLYAEAAERLEKLLAAHPGNPHLLARLERLGAQSGVQSLRIEDDEEGFVDLQAEILDTAGLSLASGFEGFEDFEVSELDDIVQEFKSGIADKLGEEDWETHYNLGMAYREMGLMEDAIQEFQVAARSPEKAKDAYSSMALVYRETGNNTDALAALRMALAVPGNVPEDRTAILFEVGAVAEADGDWEQAVQAFEKVAENDPAHRDVQARLRKLRARVEA